MGTSSTSGYSGTPLAKKLGYKASSRVLLLDPPEDYLTMVKPLPEGVVFVRSATSETEMVHVFAIERDKLTNQLKALRKKLNASAAVWVSWPKKSAKVPTNITEDIIREVALPLGFVDIKVCAVSDIWSGLKLVVRKKLR